jgi:hypothetical protein
MHCAWPNDQFYYTVHLERAYQSPMLVPARPHGGQDEGLTGTESVRYIPEFSCFSL